MVRDRGANKDWGDVLSEKAGLTAMDLPSCAFTDDDEGGPVFGMGVVVVSGKREHRTA